MGRSRPAAPFATTLGRWPSLLALTSALPTGALLCCVLFDLLSRLSIEASPDLPRSSYWLLAISAVSMPTLLAGIVLVGRHRADGPRWPTGRVALVALASGCVTLSIISRRGSDFLVPVSTLNTLLGAGAAVALLASLWRIAPLQQTQNSG